MHVVKRSPFKDEERRSAHNRSGDKIAGLGDCECDAFCLGRRESEIIDPHVSRTAEAWTVLSFPITWKL